MLSLFFASQHPVLRALVDLCFGWIVVYAARTIWRHLRTSSRLGHVPGPRNPSWFWGNEWEMHRAIPGALYIEWQKNHGGIVKLKGAFGRNILAISDYRTATHILGGHVFEFPKPTGVREWFRLLVGEGLLVAEGKDVHARQRKIFTHALDQPSIRPLLNVFYENASKIADNWASRIDNASGDFIIEDVQRWSNRFSLDTIGSAAFSYDFASLSGINNPLVHALESLGNTADNFSSFVMKALFYTFPWILSIPSEKGKLIKSTREELGKVATQMWNDRKAAGDVGAKTLMSTMIKVDRNAGNDSMNEEEIAAQLRTLVQAGYEPVSPAIAWLLYELACYPELQERVRQEISACPGDPDYDFLLTKVPLLNAVIKETMRLHPPVLELTHVAAKDSLVPLSRPLPGKSDFTLKIPAGTIINIPVNVMQTDTDVWGQDAAEFRPERWLEMETDKAAERIDPRKNLMAFSFGPRKCPGQAFATMEMKALVITILRQFTLTTIPDKPIQPFWSFVVRARVQGERDSTLPLRISKIKYSV